MAEINCDSYSCKWNSERICKKHKINMIYYNGFATCDSKLTAVSSHQNPQDFDNKQEQADCCHKQPSKSTGF